MAKGRTLREEWETYSELIFRDMSPGPSSIQVDETHQAFCAGYFSAMCAFRAIGCDIASEEEGVEILDERWRESLAECAAIAKRTTDNPRPTPKQMRDMTEPEIKSLMDDLMRYVKQRQTSDTLGAVLVLYQKDGISQYASSIQRSCAPSALRELADRLESRNTAER